MVARPTRRTLLRGAGAGLLGASAASALAACGGGDAHDDDGLGTGAGAGAIPESTGGDAGLLNGALAAEHTLIAAYTAGSPLLGGAAAAAAQRFLAQEREHAARLRELVRFAGGTPTGPAASYDFGVPATDADALRLLHRVEQQAIAVYVGVIPRIADAATRADAAAIAANEAEHVAVLLQRLGRWPVPSAFVAGGP